MCRGAPEVLDGSPLMIGGANRILARTEAPHEEPRHPTCYQRDSARR